MPGLAGLSVTEEECVWAMDCFHQQYLLITVVLTVAGDHSTAAFGDMSRSIWEVTVQNGMLWFVKGQGTKLSYYQPPLLQEKADFYKKSSHCPREGGMTSHGPLSPNMLSSLCQRVSRWYSEVSICQDSGCIISEVKIQFLSPLMVKG